MQQPDIFGPPAPEQEPPTPKASAPPKLSPFALMYISLCGVGPELIRAYADPADLSSLRTRTAALLVNFVFGVVFMTTGAMPVFAAPGTFNPAVLAIAILICFVKLRMECFLSLRGLYAAGKQALRKQGLKIPFGSDDIAWYFALTTKAAGDISIALVVGSLSAQTFFVREITTDLAKSVTHLNAPLVNLYRPQVEAATKAAEKVKLNDATNADNLKSAEDSLRKQQVLDVRRGTVRARDRQPEAEASRQRTNSTLAAYEAKAVAAKAQAANSAKAHDELLKSSGARLDALVKADPAYVAPPEGLLARMGALRAIGKQDSQVFWGEALIEAIGVFLEMFLLVLSIARCPTHLSENLYLDYYSRANARAVKLSKELEAITSPPLAPKDLDVFPPSGGATGMGVTPPDTPPPPPPKRGRGRPRNAERNGQLAVISNKQQGSN